MEQVIHSTVNGKYSVRIEKAASANKTIGWKVEANGDDKEILMADILELASKADGISREVPL